MKYKIVPFEGLIREYAEDEAAATGDQLEKTINEYAEEGWDFYSIETIRSQVRPGCLGMLRGMKEKVFDFHYIVFRRK